MTMEYWFSGTLTFPDGAAIEAAREELDEEGFADSEDYVIQDDTGIPYRFLQQSPWRVRLFGQYHKPIKELRYGYQPDLESAYRARTQVPDLPFPFGYHWRGKQSGLLIANR